MQCTIKDNTCKKRKDHIQMPHFYAHNKHTHIKDHTIISMNINNPRQTQNSSTE